jgi:type I restriction enzyme S subunit
MNQQFFFRWCQFLKPWIEEAASATVNAAILNKGRLSQGPVIVPSKGEQAEIAERINGAFRAADIMQKQCKEASIRLNTLDQAILAKAFRGELVPQDPTDEPASVLLDRIRAEREAAAKKPKAKKRRKKT